MRRPEHLKYTYCVPQPNQKGIHIHIPKTAGVCVNCYLKDIAPEMVLSHASAYFVRNRMNSRFPGTWDKMFTFAFVRNPWDRLVSLCLYHNRHRATNIGFDEFLMGGKRHLVDEYSIDLVFNSPFEQKSFLCDAKGKVLVDFIGKMENFTEDFNYVRERLGLPPQEKFIVLNSQFKYKYDGDYRGYYNKESRRFVGDLCKWEIEKFGYAF